MIVDDQPLARLRLRDLLDEIDGIEILGEAADGDSALRLIANTRPDLAFLDIQMPGPSGLDVLRRADPRPLAVFTTAHDEHAVTAFELAALDYLLKPFGAERLRAAIERARARRQATEGTASEEPWVRAAPLRDPERPLDRIYVRLRGKIVPVRLDEVEHLQANGDYVTLWLGGLDYLVRVSLTTLTERLDPNRFVRIHRSHAINLDRVKEFRSHDASRICVVLRSGKEVVASRTRSIELRQRFMV